MVDVTAAVDLAPQKVPSGQLFRFEPSRCSSSAAGGVSYPPRPHLAAALLEEIQASAADRQAAAAGASSGVVVNTSSAAASTTLMTQNQGCSGVKSTGRSGGGLDDPYAWVPPAEADGGGEAVALGMSKPKEATMRPKTAQVSLV